MNQDGIMPLNTSTENRFQYNGKELEKDGGIDLSDYGARWYDASVGRWISVDPLADTMPSWSPYNYTFNNPLLYTDPNGKSPDPFYYMLDGLATYFASIGSVIDDAGATVSGWFGFRKGFYELKYKATASTTVEDFFTENGNSNKPVTFLPVKGEFSTEETVNVKKNFFYIGPEVVVKGKASLNSITGEKKGRVEVILGAKNKGPFGAVEYSSKNGTKVEVGAKVEYKTPKLKGWSLFWGGKASVSKKIKN